MEAQLISFLGRDPAHLIVLLLIGYWINFRIGRVDRRLVKIETELGIFHALHRLKVNTDDSKTHVDGA